MHKHKILTHAYINAQITMTENVNIFHISQRVVLIMSYSEHIWHTMICIIYMGNHIHHAFLMLFNWLAYMMDMRKAFNTRHTASNPKHFSPTLDSTPVKLTIKIRGKSTQQQSSAALCEMKHPAVSQSTETTPENTWDLRETIIKTTDPTELIPTSPTAQTDRQTQQKHTKPVWCKQQIHPGLRFFTCFMVKMVHLIMKETWFEESFMFETQTLQKQTLQIPTLLNITD